MLFTYLDVEITYFTSEKIGKNRKQLFNGWQISLKKVEIIPE